MAINKNSFAFTVYLGGLGILPPLSIDMGLPALSSIATSLHTTPGMSALTLSLFLAGFAVAPIVGGPCADRFGRRPVLLCGCLLFALAAIACTFAPTIEILLAFRLIQGIGAGAAAVLSMVVVRDLFEGNEARARLSYVSILRSLGPMIAPTIGAWLLTFSNWRWIYGLLAFAGVVLLIVTERGFAESAKHDRVPFTLSALKASYAEVISHRVSFGYAAVNALVFGGMFAYVSNSPLLMIQSFGLSNQMFGYLFAGTAMGIMLGAFVNGKLSERNIAHTKPLFAGLLLACIATTVNVALTLLGLAAPWTLLPCLFLYTFSAGLIASNCTHGCLHPMPRIAGVASAVLTFTQMVVGAVSSAIVAFLYNGSALAMTGIMAAFIYSAAAVYFLCVRPAEKKC
ncbi:MAG: multidrug effflux MFS transporter [Candidatus Obscuribacterales bacterium]|nr:multidrug effflux MFS transporter [Candidatus Obscuribacterales bacterium]